MPSTGRLSCIISVISSLARITSGTPPSTEKPEFAYPLVVIKDSGEKCLVVTAYEFGKYLGFLKV